MVALVGALTACSSGSDKPQTLPSIKPPSVSASPSASVDATRDNTPEGAAAFVRAYYEQVNEAAATGRTAAVKRMIARECPCRALVKYIDDAYKVGSLRGFKYSIRDVRTDDFEGKIALVAVFYSVGRIEELNKQGAVTAVVPPVSDGQKAVTVVRVGSGWLIDNVHNLGR